MRRVRRSRHRRLSLLYNLVSRVCCNVLVTNYLLASARCTALLLLCFDSLASMPRSSSCSSSCLSRPYSYTLHPVIPSLFFLSKFLLPFVALLP